MTDGLALPADTDLSAPASLDGVRRRAWMVATVGIAASGLGFALDSTQFYRSYLVSWVFWLSVAAGCLAILMLQYLIETE